MVVVKDGYLIGTAGGRQKRCGHCGEKTLCIDIDGVVLPKGMTVKATILQDRAVAEPHCIAQIGVGCGCYARLHRQIAHINDSRLHSGAALV